MHRTVSALLLAGALAGCTSGGTDGERPVVASGAYPFSWLVSQVGGDAVELVDLVQPGVEPHDVELGPRQVGQVRSADLVVGVRGFQPALDDALAAPDALWDVGAQVGQLDGEGGADPHVWLDPRRMATAATGLADRLAELVPAEAEAVRARGAAVAQELTALDGELADGLGSCERRDLVTAHTAFAYLADRYDLRQVGISGLSPDAEPSPGRIAEVARFAEANDVTTIFFEELVDPSVAQTLAAEVGATTAVLDPLESAPEGGYASAMRRNLAALRTGLGCR